MHTTRRHIVTQEQFKKASQYWNNKEQIPVPEKELNKTVEEYISSNNTCALATGIGDYVRCTPIEYSYHDGKLKSIQVMGKAEIVEPFSDIYCAHAAYKKIPIVALQKLETPMNLICVTPVKAEVLCSEFKEEGYSSRQTYLF